MGVTDLVSGRQGDRARGDERDDILIIDTAGRRLHKLFGRGAGIAWQPLQRS
jgi:hypothetical protein